MHKQLRRMAFCRKAALLAGVLLVGACSNIPFIGGSKDEPTPKPAGSTGLVGEKLVSDDSLPPGTVPRSDGSYMVPVGPPDDEGCQAYRVWAPQRAVVQVIYYRRADQSFTPNKKEAACVN